MAFNRRWCLDCGTSFFPVRGNQDRCAACRVADQKRRAAIRDKVRRTRARESEVPFELTCAACKRPFTSDRKVVYCYRPECRTARNTARMQRYFEGYAERTGRPYVIKRNPETRQRNSAERRARTRGARVGAPFTRQYIGERDSWQCALCGQPIDPTLKWPDPMSQSLEHIVPLALGGEHSSDNCTVAHLSCNSRGGTRHAQARARMLHNLQ